METMAILLTVNLLLAVILGCLLIILSLNGNTRSSGKRVRVREDITKIKNQINGDLD